MTLLFSDLAEGFGEMTGSELARGETVEARPSVLRGRGGAADSRRSSPVFFTTAGAGRLARASAVASRGAAASVPRARLFSEGAALDAFGATGAFPSALRPAESPAAATD